MSSNRAPISVSYSFQVKHFLSVCYRDERFCERGIKLENIRLKEHLCKPFLGANNGKVVAKHTTREINMISYDIFVYFIMKVTLLSVGRLRVVKRKRVFALLHY